MNCKGLWGNMTTTMMGRVTLMFNGVDFESLTGSKWFLAEAFYALYIFGSEKDR